MRLGKVRAVGALPLEEVRDRVQAEAVDAKLQPEPYDVQHGLLHGGVVVVEVGLVREEAVPVELLAYGIEGPVRRLGVAEDDAYAGVVGVGVPPDEVVAERAVGVIARFLKPAVRVRRVVEHEVRDNPYAPSVRLVNKCHEIVQRAVLRGDLVIVPNVVTAVASRGVVEGRQPEAVDAQPLEVVQLGREAAQVTVPVVVGVEVRLDEDLIEHGSLVPVGFDRHRSRSANGRARLLEQVGHDAASAEASTSAVMMPPPRRRVRRRS